MNLKQSKILIISDIHGNAEGLKAVLKKESGYDFLVFLGDSVLSGPQPKETAEILLDVKPDINIMGNHDESWEIIGDSGNGWFSSFSRFNSLPTPIHKGGGAKPYWGILPVEPYE